MNAAARRPGRERIPANKKSFLRTLGGQWQMAVMSVPVLLYVLLFNYFPMRGWIAAFQNFDPKIGFAGSQFTGLKNFIDLFGYGDLPPEEFLIVFRNTLAMSIINLVFGTVSSILLAVLLNELRLKWFKRTVQTVTYLPHFLSMVIVVSMATNIFATEGSVNDLLLGLGIIKEPEPPMPAGGGGMGGMM